MPTAEVDGRAYSMEEAGSFVVGIGWISFQPAA
jgi:hypothetical protein